MDQTNHLAAFAFDSYSSAMRLNVSAALSSVMPLASRRQAALAREGHRRGPHRSYLQ